MEHNLSMIEENNVDQRRNSEVRARRGSSSSMKVRENLEHLKRVLYNNRNIEKEELENKKIFLGETVALIEEAKRTGPQPSQHDPQEFERADGNTRQITPVPNIRSLNKTLDYPWNDPLRKEYAVFKIHQAANQQSLNHNSDKDVLLSQIKAADNPFLPSSSPSPTHYKGQDDATSIYPGESHFIMQPRNIHSRARSSISPKHIRIESRASSCHRRDSSDIHISMLPGTSHQILVNPTLLRYSKGETFSTQMTHFEYQSENGEHVFLEKGNQEKPRKTNWVLYKEQIQENAKKRKSSTNLTNPPQQIANLKLDYIGAPKTHHQALLKSAANLSGKQLIPYYSPKQLTMPREMIIKRIKATRGVAPPTSSAFTSMRQSKNTITSDPYQLVGTPLTPNVPKGVSLNKTEDIETLPTYYEKFGSYVGKGSHGKRIGPISVEIKRSESKKKEPKRVNSGSSRVTIKGAIPQHRRAKTLKNIRFAFHQKEKKKNANDSHRTPRSNGGGSGRVHSISKRQALLLKMQRPLQNTEYEPIKTQSNVLQPDFKENKEM